MGDPEPGAPPPGLRFVRAGRAGEFLAVDEGYSNRKRAAHHNLLLVDGQGYADEDRYHVYEGIPYERQAGQRDVLADAEGGWAHATAEIAAMYDPALGLRRLDRTLVFTPSGRLVLLDLAEAEEERAWTFLLQTDRPAELGPGGEALIRSGKATALLQRFAPSDAAVGCEVTEVEANPTSSTPELRLTRTLHTLRATTPRSAEGAFLTALTPGGSPGGPPDEPPGGSPAGSPRGERITCDEGFGVRFTDTRETVLLSPVGRRVRTEAVDAHAAAVLLGPDGTPYTVGCTRLEVDGRVLLDVSEPYTGKVG